MGCEMTYRIPTRTPSRPCTYTHPAHPHTLHAQKTYTQTYTAYTDGDLHAQGGY
jgi:hypothetical protein